MTVDSSQMTVDLRSHLSPVNCHPSAVPHRRLQFRPGAADTHGMTRTDTSGMLASFLAGTAMPAAEIEEIIRGQFPSADAAAVVTEATASRSYTSQ